MRKKKTLKWVLLLAICVNWFTPVGAIASHGYYQESWWSVFFSWFSSDGYEEYYEEWSYGGPAYGTPVGACSPVIVGKYVED